jgi:hypothetical protein
MYWYYVLVLMLTATKKEKSLVATLIYTWFSNKGLHECFIRTQLPNLISVVFNPRPTDHMQPDKSFLCPANIFSIFLSFQITIAEYLVIYFKEVGLEVNPEKTKYMLVSRCQKPGQRQSIKIANRPFDDMAKFKYLGTTLTDQNSIHEEIKSRLNSGNACYHLVQSLLSSRLLSRNVKVKIHKTIILPVVLYRCQT